MLLKTWVKTRFDDNNSYFLHMQLTMVSKPFNQKVLSQMIVSRCIYDFIVILLIT